MREGELNEVVKDNKTELRWFVLFNDILIKCKLPKGSTVKKKTNTSQGPPKFEYVAQIALASSSVVNTGDEGDIKHSFQVCWDVLL